MKIKEYYNVKIWESTPLGMYHLKQTEKFNDINDIYKIFTYNIYKTDKKYKFTVEKVAVENIAEFEL